MGNHDVDLELGGRRRARRPTVINIPGLGARRSMSTGSMASQLKSPNFDEGGPQNLTDTERKYQTSLVSLMVGDQPLKGSLRGSCAWYTAFLETKYRSHWEPLCRALKGLPDRSAAPQPGDLVTVYGFMIAVAELLKTKRNLALVEIVDYLDNNNLLKPQLDDQRATPNQMVFAAIGWLTMLYEAQADPEPDKFQVTNTSTSAFGYRNALSTRKFSAYTQGFQYIDLPLYNMLNRFGDLIPDLGFTPAREPRFPGGQSTECIIPQLVCWDTLHNVAELKIEWVTALSLHLEFDSGKRTLKLFRYPSYVRMMSCYRTKNLLSQLLNNYTASINGDVRAPDIPTEEFFREILLSYRLIFGQDERSWKAFTKEIHWEEQSGVGSCEDSWSYDPMLITLCGKSSNSPAAKEIYNEIDANEPAKSYELSTDFQFFGRKLLELQFFVKQHQPRTLKALWSDRRDVQAWWTLLGNQILIFVASFTILLVILQLVFQIWQAWLAQQQVALAQQQIALAQQQLDQVSKRLIF